MKIFRIYHLLLGLAALAAYLTAEDLGLVHAWLGYTIAALLTLRVTFGLTGLRGFQLGRLVPGFGTGQVGNFGIRHPAISRLLILAIFGCVAGASITGVTMDQGGTLVGKSIRSDEREPNAGAEEQDHEDHKTGSAVIQSLFAGPAKADVPEREGEEEDGPLGELHEAFGNLILPLVGLHVLYLLLFRFELARFMLFAQRRRN